MCSSALNWFLTTFVPSALNLLMASQLWNLCTRIFRNFTRIFDKSKLLGVHLPPQLYTTEWTARHKPWKKFTKKQNIQFFQPSAPAISVASPLHWIINVVNNNLKKPCLLHLREIHNSTLTYLGFQRLENLA